MQHHSRVMHLHQEQARAGWYSEDSEEVRELSSYENIVSVKFSRYNLYVGYNPVQVDLI